MVRFTFVASPGHLPAAEALQPAELRVSLLLLKNMHMNVLTNATSKLLGQRVGEKDQSSQAINAVTGESSTFQSIFFPGNSAVRVRVPDYQRAFSWEQKQIELFLEDLKKYLGTNGYYFGHFIAEKNGEWWDIVDGQQRITTFVMFLMVCRVLSPAGAHASAYSLIPGFKTVSYDDAALRTICSNLGAFLGANRHFHLKNPPSDEQIKAGLSLRGDFTRSQRRIVWALLRIHQAFQKGELEQDHIAGYVEVIMTAHCSHHLPKDKSVAVHIFEMHNTRGIPLTTLEIIKALLMKFVYDRGGEDRESKVGQIQDEFGKIYGMEERLATHSFRGEMTMEQLLRLHLRVVDDGTKKTQKDFRLPAINADSDALVEYVDSRLKYEDDGKTEGKNPAAGLQYALNLAREFKKSVRIVSEMLPAWDTEDALVGDLLILERDLSCQFFLIACRCLEKVQGKADGRIGSDSLLLWEKLLFTRDFHEKYHHLTYRDNFPELFEALFAGCGTDESRISELIDGYLADGFRPDRTKGLQSIVREFLIQYKESVLNNAFYWSKPKMIYAIYKYEVSRGANIREVMKGTISVEHILPQEWEWEWIEGSCEGPGKLSDEERDKWLKDVGSFINGIGNLLLLTPGENTSAGKNHPVDKRYKCCTGGSYEEHNRNGERWRSPKEWSNLIRKRGEKIFEFMIGTLVEASEKTPTF